MTMNALQSLANGSLTGKREQRIHTPQYLLDAIAGVWPEGIALDPCYSPDGLVVADRFIGPGMEEEDGLTVEWPERSFANPPYADLKAWLEHARKFDEVMLLGPVRSHRTWWQHTAFKGDRCPHICWLKPVKFDGYKQTFPAPLSMMYWGGKFNAFRHFFSPHGTVTSKRDFA